MNNIKEQTFKTLFTSTIWDEFSQFKFWLPNLNGEYCEGEFNYLIYETKELNDVEKFQIELNMLNDGLYDTLKDLHIDDDDDI